MHVWEACTKNPGHQKFISVNEFFKNHLPKNHLPNDLVYDFDKSGIDIADTVRHLADVTVRLHVSYVSHERPSGYPFDSYRGRTIQRFGSGWITDIREDRTGNTCPCAGCSSTSERRERYCFHVRTACHVVYNTEEAKSTMVDLFYDDETNSVSESEKEALRNRRCRKQLQCIDLVSSNSHLDVTTLVCATHDSEIYHRLKSALCLLERQQSKLEENFECLSFKEKFDVCEPSKPKSRRPSLRHLPPQSYVLIISHPHGMPKKVTVGVLQSLEKSSDGALYRPVYDATTCPGSSGAPVFILPRKSSVTRGGMIKLQDILKHRSVNLTEIFYTHCTWKESSFLHEKVTGNCMLSAKRLRNAVFHYTQCPGPGLPLHKTQGKKKTGEILCFMNTTKSSPGQSGKHTGKSPRDRKLSC